MKKQVRSKSSGKDAGPPHDLPLIAAAEIKRIEARDIVVKSDDHVVIAPEKNKGAHLYRVRLESLNDLRCVGIVPAKMSIDELKMALRKDDERAYELASRSYAQAMKASSCSCTDEGEKGHVHALTMEQHYGRIREESNRSLAELFSTVHQRDIAWHMPFVRTTSNWSRGVLSGRITQILGILFRDVVIQSNSSLTVSPMARSFMARSIAIHATGRLVKPNAGYLKIWANSLERWTPLYKPVKDAALYTNISF